MSLLMDTRGIDPKGSMQDPGGPVKTGQAQPDMVRGGPTRTGTPHGAVQASRGSWSPEVAESCQSLFVVSPMFPMCIPHCFSPVQMSSVQSSSQNHTLKKFVTQIERGNAAVHIEDING
ncbi:hypothetical protein FKM82_013921 [Ascaphus truei]